MTTPVVRFVSSHWAQTSEAAPPGTHLSCARSPRGARLREGRGRWSPVHVVQLLVVVQFIRQTAAQCPLFQ